MTDEGPGAGPSSSRAVHDFRAAARQALAGVTGVLREETSHVAPRVMLAQAALAPLPSFSCVRLRPAILRAAGFRIGRGTAILGRIRFSGSSAPQSRVIIGSEVIINFGCLFDAAEDIHIGDRVGIGQEVMILTNGHRIGSTGQRLGPLDARPVRVEAGAWLSTRAVLLPGVTIGSGAVVAAGAVVTESVEPDVVVGGVPARPLRRLPPLDDPQTL